MVHLKPKSESEQEVAIARRGFRFQHLLLFIFGSAIAHALIFLLLARYETIKPVEEPEESKPIEFVVVPPEEESPEPPPETNNRAAENSVAEPNVQPEPTAPNTEIAEEPATAPPPPSAPVPAPSPEVAAKPEPAPAPEPEPSAEDLISGSDAPVNTPKPEEETTIQDTAQDNVATRLPPETQPESSSSSEGSAADLLGGNYQKTLADGGGDAFFSPEALTHEAVLNPSQLNALKDVDLSAYFAEIKRRVKRNWHPSYSSEEHTTYLTFNIQKNGQITDLQVSKSSGSQKLDRESLEAVQNSAPFDSLPANFPLESLEIEFSFNIYLY